MHVIATNNRILREIRLLILAMVRGSFFLHRTGHSFLTTIRNVAISSSFSPSMHPAHDGESCGPIP